jgi:hypothetical protein
VLSCISSTSRSKCGAGVVSAAVPGQREILMAKFAPARAPTSSVSAYLLTRLSAQLRRTSQDRACRLLANDLS